jgi:hypothetical protein
MVEGGRVGEQILVVVEVGESLVDLALVLRPGGWQVFQEAVVYLLHPTLTCIMSRNPLCTIRGFLDATMESKTSLNRAAEGSACSGTARPAVCFY